MSQVRHLDGRVVRIVGIGERVWRHGATEAIGHYDGEIGELVLSRAGHLVLEGVLARISTVDAMSRNRRNGSSCAARVLVVGFGFGSGGIAGCCGKLVLVAQEIHDVLPGLKIGGGLEARPTSAHCASHRATKPHQR
jgi:hypothetical protein